MKKLIAFTLFFSCLFLFAQEKKLPAQIASALEIMYPEAELENWTVVGNLYYLDFYLISKSYTSIFNSRGIWIETSEIISELDIPSELENFIGENFEEGIISYCEKVKSPDLELIRVSLYNNDEFILLQCEVDGSNIKIVEKSYSY